MEIVVLIIKIILTIFLFILCSLCFKVFYDCIKEHLNEAKIYINQRNIALENFKKENKSLIDPVGWAAIEPNQKKYLNKLAEAYNNEKKIVKQDVLNLLKAIIVPLGSISVIWFGRPF